MAGPRTLPLSAGVYVRNNAIADRNGRRGPQALQLSKKKQGSITVLDCESSICNAIPWRMAYAVTVRLISCGLVCTSRWKQRETWQVDVGA